MNGNIEKLLEEEKIKIKKDFDYLELYKKNSYYLSPQIQKIVDQLVSLYDDVNDKNPVTFAKQLDLILTTVLDEITIKFMDSQKRYESEDKSDIINFLKIIIQTLVKSLNIYKNSLKSIQE